MESSNRRLFKNTLFLYFRTVLLMVIGVFTSRITLQALGIDNYGIVNVVSGFVAMFSIISGSLTSACQRFLTFELGTSRPNIRNVFNASVLIHIALALIIVIAAETFGLYFVGNKMNFPEGRLLGVHWVFQCSVISFVISLINIPYNAIIIAYEKMAVFAYISLLEGILKLLVVVALLYVNTDKLILYAILGLCSAIIVRIVFLIYCRKAFGEDIKLHRHFDTTLTKRIFGFAGWSFIGNSATIFSNQGVNIVINIFCGVAVNAARGIAVMVESIITGFVTNFTTALNPQITKAYASGEQSSLETLVDLGMRASFFLMLIIAIPVIIAADKLLDIWFVTVPEYASIFVKCTLVYAIIQAMGQPFLTVLLASGKIKSYQIVVGLLTFLNFPISYLLLKAGMSPVSTYILLILISLVSFVVRLVYVRKKASLKITRYAQTILTKILTTGTISFLLSYGLKFIIAPGDLLSLVAYGATSCILTISAIYIFGLNSSNRKLVLNILSNKLSRIRD